jgi:KaiC/GvpD/RAD55 family RecA-like ATPase
MYCSDEIETFCRRRAVQQAILAAPKMIADEDYGGVENLIKDAISVSLNRELGLEYFLSPLERLRALAATPQRTPTLWTAFDQLLGGGLARKEILLFSANSGGGKSITLANLALNFLMQEKFPGAGKKMDVLYISLELSEELIAQRFDTMYTGISSVCWQDNYRRIADEVKDIGQHMGRLTIKHMPSGTNANAIRGFLKEFELKNGYIPDLLVIDYLDIMGANEHVSADNVFEKDKRSAEQLRDILFEYNMYGATASQQNRSAIDAQELNHSHIAGGISKVNTVDWYVSIIMNSTMKAAGEIGFAFLKTRSSDGVGKTIYLKWDNNSLRIKNMPKDEEVDDDGVISNKIADLKAKRTPKQQKLLDIFDLPES